jgi:predicted NAD/FAD-binding protein
MGLQGSGKKIAVIGTGISGMSAAWLLGRRHDVTVYERAGRLGGHSNTVTVACRRGTIPVDTGFIVYNEDTYPNLTALFRHLGTPTRPSDMSFSVSLRGGALEYAGTDLRSLFAQKRNLARARFWSMLRDLARFYRSAMRDLERLASCISLGDYLEAGRYGAAFRDDHLLPMGAAIWSMPARALLDYPAAAFIRFFHNHGLLKLRDRPVWRTVDGGSRIYVEGLTRGYAARLRLNAEVQAVRRMDGAIVVRDRRHGLARFDAVVIATHADQALALLADPSSQEKRLLGAFSYSRNDAVLHGDQGLMPQRRAVWSSWNYLQGDRQDARHESPGSPSVTYWMNRLQNLTSDTPLFVTLNPLRPPARGTLRHEEAYDHPMFDRAALVAQQDLWSLQGQRNTWFCGAYFGAGFHEDGLQAGLAVAEALGGVRRPWTVPGESDRIGPRPADDASTRELAA